MNYEKNYYDYCSYVKTLNRKKEKRLLKDGSLNPNYVYYEIHHILPKSIGGSNEKYNLVLLTAREHYLAHYLLYKIYLNYNNSLTNKMSLAFHLMSMYNGSSDRKYKNSRLYEKTKVNLNEYIKSINLGRSCTIDRKKRLSEVFSNYKWYKNELTNEEKFVIPGSLDITWVPGRINKPTDKMRNRLSEYNKKGNQKGKHWNLKQSTKDKHIGKKWFVDNKSGKEFKDFLENVDLTKCRLGRNFKRKK